MVDIFEAASKKIKDSYTVIWIFVMSLLMLVVGVNHFWEDTLSSRYGIGQLETVLGLVPVSYPLTYWSMSIAPQIAQVVFGYMFLSNTKKNLWALGVFVAALGIDFFADSWYRSGQGLFDSPEKFFSSFLLTLGYFTVGSEGFITVGFGMVAELVYPTGVQAKKLLKQILGAYTHSPIVSKSPMPNRERPITRQPERRADFVPDRMYDDNIPHLHDIPGWERFIVRLQNKPRGERDRILQRMTKEQRQMAMEMLNRGRVFVSET